MIIDAALIIGEVVGGGTRRREKGGKGSSR